MIDKTYSSERKTYKRKHNDILNLVHVAQNLKLKKMYTKKATHDGFFMGWGSISSYAESKKCR